MTTMPAFCDSCGNIFASRYAFGGRVRVENVNVRCPRCGSWAHVPDGIYEIVGNTIKILSAPERTTYELTRLAEILSEAQRKPDEPGLEKKIESELPAFGYLAKFWPKETRDRIALISLILTAITLIRSLTTRPLPPTTQAKPNIGRNDPCICGSGKPFKKCCGQLKK